MIYIILFIGVFMMLYFLYMIIREGLWRVLRLYLIAYTEWDNYRSNYKYPNAVLALKKLNFIFAKYTLYRLLSL